MLYSLTNYISKDLILQGLIRAGSGVATAVSYIIQENDEPQVKHALEDLDLVATVAIITSLVGEMQGSTKERRSHHLALNNIHETVTQIHDELQTLQGDMKNHKERIFSSWRSYPKVDERLHRLKVLSALLHQRLQLFIQVFQLAL